MVVSDRRPRRQADHAGGRCPRPGPQPERCRPGLMRLEEEIKARAHELGFLACGITHPGPSLHAEYLDGWLAHGQPGTMRYLHRQAARRREPQRIAPEARSVVVVLDNYF